MELGSGLSPIHKPQLMRARIILTGVRIVATIGGEERIANKGEWTMRTVLAGLMVLVTGLAFGQCPLCSPGTTPNTYRITFASTSDGSINGKTFNMAYLGGNVWRSEWRVAPATPSEAAAFDYTYGAPQQRIPGRIVTFYHAGYNPNNKTFAGRPGQGFISPNVAGIACLDGGNDIAGFVATAGERNGSGPFVIPLSIGGTATVQP